MSGVIRLEPAHAYIAQALHRSSFTAPWTGAEFARLLEQPGIAGLMWCATDGGDAVPKGFIVIRAVADEAEILTLAVAPAYRRAGIAAHLVAEACEMLRAGGTQRLFLEVAADNLPARALYEAQGFVATGRREGYYDRGAAARVDALVMTRALAPACMSAPPHH